MEVSSGVIMKFSLELSGFVNHDIQDITALKIGVKSCIGLAIYIWSNQKNALSPYKNDLLLTHFMNTIVRSTCIKLNIH
ncbi:MAG: hypothetical protein AB7U98_02255 [Candidatus Nitrosocosmicus sp.]|uniref:hypothetical protein n=1 Tax=Candidatus Nitrosocosmicus sp. FF01 TaxID=3397670 RepID=UPI0039E7A467